MKNNSNSSNSVIELAKEIVHTSEKENATEETKIKNDIQTPARIRPQRPTTLEKGVTYKIQVKNNVKIYVTINPFPDDPIRPFEIFVNSYSMEDMSEINALTTSLSALFRTVKDWQFIIKKLKSTKAPIGCWSYDSDLQKGIYIPGVPYALGYCLEKFINKRKKIVKDMQQEDQKYLEICARCGQKTLCNTSGCIYCLNPDCQYSKGCDG